MYQKIEMYLDFYLIKCLRVCTIFEVKGERMSATFVLNYFKELIGKPKFGKSRENTCGLFYLPLE